MSAQKVYQQIVNEDNGGPRHVVQTPRTESKLKTFKRRKVVSGYHIKEVGISDPEMGLLTILHKASRSSS